MKWVWETSSRRETCMEWEGKWIKLILINCLIILDEHIFYDYVLSVRASFVLFLLYFYVTNARNAFNFTSTDWYLHSSWLHNWVHGCLNRSFLIVSMRTMMETLTLNGFNKISTGKELFVQHSTNIFRSLKCCFLLAPFCWRLMRQMWKNIHHLLSLFNVSIIHLSKTNDFN